MFRFALMSTAAFVFAATAPAAAQPAPGGASPAGAAGGPPPYAEFTKGLTPLHGLFTLWRKNGHVYIDLAKDQLDADFIQTAVPGSGLGGFQITPGLPYLQIPTSRIVHFSRVDDKMVVTWPNTGFIATPNTPAARAVAENFATSIAATAPVVAADPESGRVVFDVSFLLGDQLDLTDALRQVLQTDRHPGSAYRLDESRSYFGPAKAFPENVIVEADQTFVSMSPPSNFDNVTDAHAIQIAVKYNFAQPPPPGSYMPRLADDRVGYYPSVQLNFDSDNVRERQVRHIVRWNLARHPFVYYLSNTIPLQYREPIRKALLTWNDAFAKIGYPNAVEVRDQPDDPAWDPDDIRYNTVHWLTLAYNGGYAQAGLVWDPRTGELLHASIVIDADLVQGSYLEGVDWTAPLNAAAENSGFESHEAAYAAGSKASALFGLAALRALGEIGTNQLPPNYVDEYLQSIVLHESGHNWGLQHNFIASEAYSPKQVRSKSFTSQFGLANSVMEYTPTNVWPKGMSNGDYFMTVLGPYDYYAIKYGYAPISGATTPEAERPTLQRWASQWSEPNYRFAMDEDVQWRTGHAIDPRVNQFDLTNDNLGWCEAQLHLVDSVVRNIPARYREPGETHDPARQAFLYTLFPLSVCAGVAQHYIAGEDLSRAHIGDPHAVPPLTPVSRAESKRAFDLLDRHIFSAGAWNMSPALLRELVYTEWVTDLPLPQWAYNPQPRHDIPVSTIVATLQEQALGAIFNPALLQRLDDLSLKYAPGATMSLEDAFTWTQTAVFGDLRSSRGVTGGAIRRTLQQSYARRLARMLLAPDPGTPYDAQSLARADLVSLRADVNYARGKAHLDTMTRAHLDALANVADQALSARTVVPVGGSGGGH